MPYDTHIYLGPSLDIATAKKIFPQAHYHPPIQCGELLRLLRLDPKRVVIIDGYYEFTPAVWHKEILYVIDQGIEVWGAASMGALRAAELHQFGMKGVGRIFQAFANGELNDDDEVAVLHTFAEDCFQPINDAMVNIRETLLTAYQQNIISKEACEYILLFCKTQFYPYRSLSSALRELALDFPIDYNALMRWITEHGMVDLKKQDTLLALEQVKQSEITQSNKALSKTPMTGYLKTLLNYVVATPFKYDENWLPDLERQFQLIAKNDPIQHKLIAELSVFMRQLIMYAPHNIKKINADLILRYIHENNLYSPEVDFLFLKQDHVISDLYVFILQLICETKLTSTLIEYYLPCIIHYYDIPSTSLTMPTTLLLKRLLIIIMLMKVRFINLNAIVDNQCVGNHLNRIAADRRYDSQKAEQWINASHLDAYDFMSFLMMYLMSSGCVQSFNGIDNPHQIEYSKWSYSVINSLHA
jgi:hypothetical protein